MDNINDNKEKWEEQKDMFKERMDSGNNFIPESRGLIKEPKETLLSSLNPMSVAKSDNWENTKGMYDTGLASAHPEK
jgi:hypothetical protein